MWKKRCICQSEQRICWCGQWHAPDGHKSKNIHIQIWIRIQTHIQKYNNTHSNKEYADVDNDTPLMVTTSPYIYIYKYKYEYKHNDKNTTIHISTECVDVDNDTPLMVPTRPDIKITCVRISQTSKIGKDTKMLMW